jgi:hypothetical protein
MMNIVQSNYGRRELDRDALRYWFSKLERFEFADVSKAFDRWIDSKDDLPTVHNILDLLKPDVTIHQRLASPIRIEDNKKHVAELKDKIVSMTKPRVDGRAWARKILDSDKAYPDIAVRFAKEALGVE